MNKREEIFKTLSDYKKTLEDKGYNVLYIGLYGSQNYNVSDELSDIDAKAIVLPTLKDIINRKVISTTYECENGAIDCKDLITFYDVIKKGNFSYIEAIDTEYSIGDKYIKNLFKQFRPNLKSILGAMHEKRAALTHPYPSKKDEFEKWGCDPKQYHHIVRLYDLLFHNRRYNEELSFLKYNAVDARNMIKLKRNTDNLSVDYMIEESDDYIECAKNLIPEDYKYESINIDDDINEYVEEKIKLELIKTSPVVSAREIRTFDNAIPKKDLEKFPILEQYKNQDISYIVYESIEIL